MKLVPITGRRALRQQLQATWSMYTPRVPGTPFSAKDIEDAADRFSSPQAQPPGPVAPFGDEPQQPADGGTRRVPEPLKYWFTLLARVSALPSSDVMAWFGNANDGDVMTFEVVEPLEAA